MARHNHALARLRIGGGNQPMRTSSMNGSNLLRLCNCNQWPEMRKYFSSDAAEEEKKSIIMYRNHVGTCLLLAFCYEVPDDIIKAMLDIGGKDLVMEIDNNDDTVLHWACGSGASHNIIKMLINIGGKDLVMAKVKSGDTALHWLCRDIKRHTKVAEKIKLILQVGDTNLLLSAKNILGQTPLEIATEEGASNVIKKLLAHQSNSNSTRSNTSLSATIVPAENRTSIITLSSQDQNTTRSSSIRGLAIGQKHQSQLREAKEKAKTNGSKTIYNVSGISHADVIDIGNDILRKSNPEAPSGARPTIVVDAHNAVYKVGRQSIKMKGSNLFSLCIHNRRSEVMKYLSSDAAEEEKKSNIMYHNRYGQTCLHAAFCRDPPDDVIKAMVAIGGKELVMKEDNDERTALHDACRYGASYTIINVLIEVGGKDLVMAKDKYGETALHWLCWLRHTKAAKKIILILEVGDANLLLATKNSNGKTPLEFATDKGASKKIKRILTVQSNSRSRKRNNNSSASIVPANNGRNTPTKQSNPEQHTTRDSSTTNNDPDITIRRLQSQLKEARKNAEMIQQDFDKKCADYTDLKKEAGSRIKEAKEQTLQIQQDYDQNCTDCCNLEEINQVESINNLKWGSAMTVLKKDLYKCKRMNLDLEHKVKAQGAERISLLAEQEGETAHAQELREESNRRAADLEAIVDTQRLENADLSNERDGIKKEYMDKVDKLTRQLSKQQAELQQLEKSSSEVKVGMKRKHTNEEHEEGEGTVAQSRTQSSKRRRAVNTRSALSDSLNSNQAEDDNAELKDMLMTRYLYTRQLQRANARIAQFEEEHDVKES